jgi:hypothetical protein
VHEDLPNLDRRLANDNNSILSNKIQRCEDAITTFLTEDLKKSTTGRFDVRGFYGYLLFL